MECRKEKGADCTSTPQELKSSPTQINYSRLVNLCLGLSVIAMAVFVLGYVRSDDRAVFLGMGMMFSSLVMHIAINPIEEDSNDEEE